MNFFVLIYFSTSEKDNLVVSGDGKNLEDPFTLLCFFLVLDNSLANPIIPFFEFYAGCYNFSPLSRLTLFPNHVASYVDYLWQHSYQFLHLSRVCPCKPVLTVFSGFPVTKIKLPNLAELLNLNAHHSLLSLSQSQWLLEIFWTCHLAHPWEIFISLTGELL